MTYKILGQFALLLEPVIKKPKHNFFVFEKFQKFDREKLKNLLETLNLPYTTSHELRLGRDDTTYYISVNFDQDIVRGVQRWAYLCYPSEVFLKKLRKPDLVTVDSKIFRSKYALYVNSATKQTLSWYRDLFLFFLLAETSFFIPTHFLILTRHQTWAILDKLQAVILLSNYRRINRTLIVYFLANLLRSQIICMFRLYGT